MTKKITDKRLKWYGHVKEKGRSARAKKNVRCTNTRKETERKTENQVETHEKRYGESVVMVGVLTGQDKVE